MSRCTWFWPACTACCVDRRDHGFVQAMDETVAGLTCLTGLQRIVFRRRFVARVRALRKRAIWTQRLMSAMEMVHLVSTTMLPMLIAMSMAVGSGTPHDITDLSDTSVGLTWGIQVLSALSAFALIMIKRQELMHSALIVTVAALREEVWRFIAMTGRYRVVGARLQSWNDSPQHASSAFKLFMGRVEKLIAQFTQSRVRAFRRNNLQDDDRDEEGGGGGAARGSNTTTSVAPSVLEVSDAGSRRASDAGVFSLHGGGAAASPGARPTFHAFSQRRGLDPQSSEPRSSDTFQTVQSRRQRSAAATLARRMRRQHTNETNRQAKLVRRVNSIDSHAGEGVFGEGRVLMANVLARRDVARRSSSMAADDGLRPSAASDADVQVAVQAAPAAPRTRMARRSSSTRVHRSLTQAASHALRMPEGGETKREGDAAVTPHTRVSSEDAAKGAAGAEASLRSQDTGDSGATRSSEQLCASAAKKMSSDDDGRAVIVTQANLHEFVVAVSDRSASSNRSMSSAQSAQERKT